MTDEVPDDDQERFRSLFASLIEDEPESRVTPLRVILEAKQHGQDRRRRIRTVGLWVAAAAVAAIIIVPLRNLGSGGSFSTAAASSSAAASAANPVAESSAAALPQVSSAASAASSSAAAAGSSAGGSAAAATGASPGAVSSAAAGSAVTDTPGVTKAGTASAGTAAGQQGPEPAASCPVPPLPAAVEAAVRMAAYGPATVGAYSEPRLPCLPGGEGASFELRVGNTTAVLTVLVLPRGACPGSTECPASGPGRAISTKLLADGRRVLVEEGLASAGTQLYSSGRLALIATAAAKALG